MKLKFLFCKQEKNFGFWLFLKKKIDISFFCAKIVLKRTKEGGIMMPVNPWEHQNAVKTFYAKCVEYVCEKHAITRMELDILLFLTNNPLYDTASDIVEVRYLSKSQVSVSVKMLEERGYLSKVYINNNRKTAHLKISEAASDIIADGKAAQEKFISAIFKDIPQEELCALKRCTARMLKNIRQYLTEE